MEAIVVAYKAYREAYKKVWFTTPAAVLWSSQERKDLNKAEDAFRKAISDSEYDEIFDDYAALTYR